MQGTRNCYNLMIVGTSYRGFRRGKGTLLVADENVHKKWGVINVLLEKGELKPKNLLF